MRKTPSLISLCLALGSLPLADVTAQVDSASFAGVYAVRREVTSSTCEHVEVGSVLANVYLISTDPSVETQTFSVAVTGARRFPDLRGDVEAGRLVLVGSDGEGGSITVALTRSLDGSLRGTETATVSAARACVTTRAVVATPLAEPARAHRGR